MLRFWETEFPQLKPNKSGAGQRLYRRREVDLARRIRHLLYEEGYTIPGARQHFQAEARKPAESGQLRLAEAGGKSAAQAGQAALGAERDSGDALYRAGRQADAGGGRGPHDAA